MPRNDKGLEYVKARMRGENPPTPGEPVSRDAAMAAGISAQLRGEQAPSDTPDAPAGIDSGTWQKAQAAARSGPSDPDYDLGTAVVTLAQRLADLEGAQP
jgi:hypothetical protein